MATKETTMTEALAAAVPPPAKTPRERKPRQLQEHAYRMSIGGKMQEFTATGRTKALAQADKLVTEPGDHPVEVEGTRREVIIHQTWTKVGVIHAEPTLFKTVVK